METDSQQEKKNHLNAMPLESPSVAMVLENPF